MNFLKTNFLCTVIKIAILIYIHERNWNSHALMFSFKRVNSCVLASIVKVGWRITIYLDRINIKDLNIFTFTYTTVWSKIMSRHVFSYQNPTHSGYSLIYRTRKPLSNIATVSASLEHAFILFKFSQDQKYNLHRRE